MPTIALTIFVNVSSSGKRSFHLLIKTPRNPLSSSETTPIGGLLSLDKLDKHRPLYKVGLLQNYARTNAMLVRDCDLDH
ncbi:hypothetical protein TNCV_254941 [Trichonephila clavipes]|nr:hypothetical protein TNCV_254941 [Trichonephila clavipes]